MGIIKFLSNIWEGIRDFFLWIIDMAFDDSEEGIY